MLYKTSKLSLVKFCPIMNIINFPTSTDIEKISSFFFDKINAMKLYFDSLFMVIVDNYAEGCFSDILYNLALFCKNFLHIYTTYCKSNIKKQGQAMPMHISQVDHQKNKDYQWNLHLKKHIKKQPLPLFVRYIKTDKEKKLTL